MATKKKVAETAPEAVQKTAEPAEVSQPSEIVGTAETAPEYAVIAQTGLNLRAEPNREAEVLAVLPKGVGVRLVRPIENPDGWVDVRTGYLTGWVMAQYLARLE